MWNNVTILLAAVITAGAVIFVHFDSKESGFSAIETVNKIRAKKNDDEKASFPPKITFPEVFITPVDTSISSSFFAEISNSGSESANEFVISVDFGEATPEKCELVSALNTVADRGESNAIKHWEISKLEAKQSIYIVCNLNAPFFKTLSVGGGNLDHVARLTFLSYKEQQEEDPTTFLEGALKAFFLFGAFILALRLMRSAGQ